MGCVRFLLYLAGCFSVTVGWSRLWTCPDFCQCPGQQSVICRNLNTVQLKRTLSALTHSNATLLNLSLINCSLFDVNSLPQPLLRSLVYLDLSYNHLNDFTFRSTGHFMPLLVVLKLSGNHLISVPRDLFSSVPNVEEVYMDHNSIFVVDWEAFRLFKLKHLWLQNNHLLSISEHVLRFIPNLESLDLGFNQLVSVQSSSFFSARRLATLNLSHNRLQRIDYDSFVPLHQLKELDLSYNNITAVPRGMSQFTGLRVLNFSGNPINVLRGGDFSLPVLQVLEVSHCPALQLIEANTFLAMPNLQTVILHDNPNLAFVSSRAFTNTTSVFEVDLRNNSLKTVFFSGFQPPKLWLSGNPLECECMPFLTDDYAIHIADVRNIRCKVADNVMVPLSQLSNQTCSGASLTPFGKVLQARVGDQVSFYCCGRQENDSVSWNYTRHFMAEKATDSLASETHHLKTLESLGLQPLELLRNAHRDRISAVGSEELRIETVVREDDQDYTCVVTREGKAVSQTKLKLHVTKPDISLFSIDVGSHYVALGWNDSLDVKWTDNVKLMLSVKDVNNSTLRVIQLNILNPWFGYNVIRLRPEQNYTFCLYYEFVYNYPGTIFEACTRVRTLATSTFWASLHPAVIAVLLSGAFFVTVTVCFRGIYVHFCIWHQAKRRARMNQSVSGQSFLSRSVTRSDTFNVERADFQDCSNSMRMSVINTPTTEDTDLSLLDQNA